MRSYVLAVTEQRCDDALNLLSAPTRHAIDALRAHPQHPNDPVPIEQYYCNALMFESCKWKRMTLSDQRADAAAVSMPCGRSQDSFLPGFSSPFLKYEPRITPLVREAGEWHVVEPLVIRIVEVREKEDRAVEAALRERERHLRANPPR
jgi:hypothetical protein